jgi:hypothetical protein
MSCTRLPPSRAPRHQSRISRHSCGGVLITRDRMFGTFVAERNDLPCRYGLAQPLLANNPRSEWWSIHRLERTPPSRVSCRCCCGGLASLFEAGKRSENAACASARCPRIWCGGDRFIRGHQRAMCTVMTTVISTRTERDARAGKLDEMAGEAHRRATRRPHPRVMSHVASRRFWQAYDRLPHKEATLGSRNIRGIRPSSLRRSTGFGQFRAGLNDRALAVEASHWLV